MHSSSCSGASTARSAIVSSCRTAADGWAIKLRMAKEDELWHLVEAKRDDGSPTIFRIREIATRREQTHIFVAELPYPVSELSRLPDAPSYRRFATFEEQWLDPACKA